MLNAYVNNIDDCLQNTTILKYADDIKIYSSQSGSSNLSPSILQHNLDSLNSWASCSQLRFNVNKCSIMHFESNNDCRKYFFSNRIVNTWNNLPDHIVLSLSLPEFKRKVCKFIENEDVKWF